MKADPTTLVALLEIQELDRTMDRLRHDRGHLPEIDEIALVDRDLAAIEVEAIEVRARRHDLERDQKRLEDEVAGIEARISAENDKLYGGSVTAVKELQSLQDELAGLAARQGRVEDQILEVMVASEPVDDELSSLATRQGEREGERERLTDIVAVRQSEIDEELGVCVATRGQAAAGVSDELLSEYDRLRSRPGQDGVARLAGSTCRGCHLDLSAVEVDRLRKLPADDLVHCDECGCILVR